MCRREIAALGEMRSDLRDLESHYDTNPLNREQRSVKRIAAEIERLIVEKDW